MELMLLVWLAESLPSFVVLLSIFSTICLIACTFTGIFLLVDGEHSHYDMQYNPEAYQRGIDKIKMMKRIIPRIMAIAFSVLLLCTLLPNKSSTVYLMAGAYATQSVATSESGKKIVKMIETKIDEALAETEKKVDNKTAAK